MFICDRGRPLVTSLLLLLLLLCSPGEGCGPGRGSGRRRKARKLTPLVFKQHVPNVSENTLGASGLADGQVRRGDANFKDLVRNNNPDIIFKDEEGTGADRIMSQRCKDKLNTLAISVLNQWPGVKLRVTEAWDEDGMHADNSLHYEGRAVDITTSDRDRSKYGMLARLAVEAGFDWVYYETRGHIHCSVKSDSSVAINFGGCFPPTSHVITHSGQMKTISQIGIGDSILSMSKDGRLEFSDVIAFLDLSESLMTNYYTLTTERGHSVTLTSKHLIYVWSSHLPSNTTPPSLTSKLPHLIFAEDATVDQYISYVHGLSAVLTEDIPQRLYGSTKSSKYPRKNLYTSEGVSALKMKPEKIVSIRLRPLKGAYAPLTAVGTVVVDGFVASCYAFIKDESLAHAVFGPLRGYHKIKTYLNDWLEDLVPYFDWVHALPSFNDRSTSQTQNGAHWYARFLHYVAVNVLKMDINISL